MKSVYKGLVLLLCLLFLLPSAALAGADASADIHSVIFMIGDGMGYNHLKLAEEQGYEIFMDDAPDLLGWSRTRSASSAVTDSAAGATALSCGVRTNNKMICVFPDEEKRAAVQPRIVTENAILHGMKTGVVTTDYTTGATPAGFSVHVPHRDNTEEIVAGQFQSGIDLIWGGYQSLASRQDAKDAGFTYVTEREELAALAACSRSYGQFADGLWKLSRPEIVPSLAEMSEKAIALLSAGKNGFFLMIEGAHIDKKADDSKDGMVDYPKKLKNTAQAVKAFDNAVRAAVKFARADGHTLVVVTADHETGDLRYEAETGRMTFHSASHSAANVPVFVYGADDLFENGAEMDNCEIVNLLAAKLGWSETFPIEDPVGTVIVPPAQQPEEADEPGEADEPARKDGFFARVLQWLRTFFSDVADFFRGLFN